GEDWARSPARRFQDSPEVRWRGQGSGASDRSSAALLPSSGAAHKAALGVAQFRSYSARPAMSAATTMRSIFLALSSALLAAPAGAAVSDFRLPAPRETQQPPDRQGPVAPDVPESRRPAPSPTPTPTASTPVPVPIVTPPAIEPPRIAAPPAAISTATPTPRASPARTTADEAELP